MIVGLPCVGRAVGRAQLTAAEGATESWAIPAGRWCRRPGRCSRSVGGPRPNGRRVGAGGQGFAAVRADAGVPGDWCFGFTLGLRCPGKGGLDQLGSCR